MFSHTYRFQVGMGWIYTNRKTNGYPLPFVDTLWIDDFPNFLRWEMFLKKILEGILPCQIGGKFPNTRKWHIQKAAQVMDPPIITCEFAWFRGRKPSGFASGFSEMVFSCRSKPCSKTPSLTNLVFTYFRTYGSCYQGHGHKLFTSARLKIQHKALTTTAYTTPCCGSPYEL